MNIIKALDQPPEKDTVTVRALAAIRQMYVWEAEAKADGWDADQVAEMRRTQTGPLLEELRTMLEGTARDYTLDAMLGKAVDYVLRNWKRLTVFLDHPRLPPDNNGVENAIRPFVVGRKNWLFAGSDRGAEVSALCYSLVETAKANGLDPYAYFLHLFTEFPKAKYEEEIRGLLPNHVELSA